MTSRGPLKLRARDAEDLRVLAGVLQDALVPLADVAYLKRDRRFVLVANRFKWESAREGARPAVPENETEAQADARFADTATNPDFERVNCGLCFDRVRGVRFRGLDPREKDQILSLLTLEAEPGAITLIFSGGGAIRLDVTAVACHLEDLGEPWPTIWRPAHEEAEGT